jgi:hypothetical protein
MPPAARRTTGPRPPARKPAAKPAAKPQFGLFERLRAEAIQDIPEVEPYVIRDVDPPIVIESPDTAEQQLALAAMFDNAGSFALSDARLILQTVCGDAFDRVWDLVRHEKLPVLLALIKEMGDHFAEQGALVAGVEEEDFPGGS